MMLNIGWYFRRMRAMSAEEAFHRARIELKKRRWRKHIQTGETKGQPLYWHNGFHTSPACAGLDLSLQSAEVQALLMEAESYLRNEWHFFNLKGVREFPLDWHADPTSGKVAPRHKLGLDINHRDEHLAGNVKTIWEKSRHHHLTCLAVAYQLTLDERFAAAVVDQILDWTNQNPYLEGINWTHPLEHGIRLIAWVWCERLIRGSRHYQKAFGKHSPVWACVCRHQEFIDSTYSHGSSANNHLIGEMAGLFVSATAWPFFDHSERWRILSHGLLEREIVRQTFPSGINRELAFSYHIFALEFFLLALIEGERSRVRFSAEYRARLRAMIEIIPHLTDFGGNLPRYGDSDDGMAIQLQARQGRRDAWLYRVGRALVNASVPCASEGKLAARVLGFDAATETQWTAPQKASEAFEDSGIYVLTSRRGESDEVFVLADAGPHGFSPLAAHAHADALSFTLSVGGQPVLVDPGTYAYYTEQRWRNYFSSTRAHNTVVVDRRDQSTRAGPFLWTQQAKAKAIAWAVTDSGAKLVGCHDGYSQIGVLHQRTIELNRRTLTLMDDVRGSGEHEVTLCFHFAPECQVEVLSGGIVHVRRDDLQLRLTIPNGLTISIARGHERAGWYSPGFAVKQETSALFADGRFPLPVSFKTVIQVGHES
jgi:hypothetical protein